MVTGARLQGAIRAAIERAAGSDAYVLGGWIGGPTVPPLPPSLESARAVYAFSGSRVSGMRHWRDTVEDEISAGGRRLHLVAHEASKWTRLLLKSHGGTIAACTGTRFVCVDGAAGAKSERTALPDDLPDDLLDELQVLAARCLDADARAWLERAGLELSTSDFAAGSRTAPLPRGSERFEALEVWLQRARDLAGEAGGTD